MPVKLVENKKVEGWLPIETAPIDRPILTYRKNADDIEKYKGMTIGGRSEHWYRVSIYHNAYKEKGWTGWFKKVQPTHWRPLPDPPDEENQATVNS